MTTLKSNSVASKPKKSADQENTDPVSPVASLPNKKQVQPCNNNDLTRPLFVILGAVGAVVGLLYVYPFVTTLFGMQKEVFTNVEHLGQRHLELEQKVLALQKIVDGQTKAQGQPANLDTLEQRIAAVELAQKNLEKELVGASVDALKQTDKNTTQTVEALKNRVDTVETRLAARQKQITKLPETIGLFEKLRDRMQTSKPFDKELVEAKGLFDPHDQAMTHRIETLMAAAKTGTPTIDELQQEFKAVAKDIRRLSIPENWPWYSKFIQRMRNLVVIRKNGEPLQGSSSTEERLAGIQQLLAVNNIEAALLEASQLPELGSEIYSNWRSQADSRLFIEQSIPIMEAHSLAYLLTGETGHPPAQGPTETKGE